LNPQAEGEGQKHPNDTPAQSFPDRHRMGMPVEYAQINGKEDENDRDKRSPE
jgi:hypothetical protein